MKDNNTILNTNKRKQVNTKPRINQRNINKSGKFIDKKRYISN